MNGSDEIIAQYYYDMADRLVKAELAGVTLYCRYDDQNRATSTTYIMANTSIQVTSAYGADSVFDVSEIKKDGAIIAKTDYDYDADLGRLTNKKVYSNATDPVIDSRYSYVDITGTAKTTTQVSSLANKKNETADYSAYTYTYDDNGNIASITNESNQIVNYRYDALNQLIRENNQASNKTVVYAYDRGGNITSVTEYAYTAAETISGQPTAVHSYGYGNAGWKDLLTEYDGASITYDAIGNPTSYLGASLSWNGRSLATFSRDGSAIVYSYNNDGIRTSKTVDGITTAYIVSGSTVLAETTNNETTYYLYDGNGELIGFNKGNAVYYYLKDVQGDITAIIDASQNIVASYSYTSYGAVTVTEDSGTTIGQNNPFRYREYYYDNETGLYYVSSRYYDPLK